MYSRTNPYIARIKERFLLTKPGSSKRTYHISLNIDGSALEFKVGDSIGILPINNPSVIDQILKKLGATGLEEIEDPRSNKTLPFREYLLHKANISKVSFHKIFNVEKTMCPLLDLIEHHKPSPQDRK